jgi:hypothetical protein
VKAKPVSLRETPTTQVAVKPVPTTSTTVEVATPEQIETPLEEVGTVPLDDSVQEIQTISATAPTQLAQTGAMTTRLALLGAFLTGIGMVILRVRTALAR